MNTGAGKRFHRRERRSMRGASLVEALVVIPAFLVLFASILFVGALYRSKLRVMRLSRESAWTYAMSNCGQPGDAVTTRYLKDDEAPAPSRLDEGTAAPDGADLDDATGHTAGAPQAAMATRSFGSAEATTAADVVADGLIGGFRRQVRSRTRVMCNEAPYVGDLRGFMNGAKNAFMDW